jgi:hypothetical protein
VWPLAVPAFVERKEMEALLKLTDASCFASCQLKKISNKVKRDENSAEGAHEADNSTIDQDGIQDEGEEMDAKEVITERVLDGGAPSDIDNEDSKGNTTMTENDGVAEQNGLQKKKAKKVFLDRRARKNLPSAEDISRVREEKRQAIREAKRKAVGVLQTEQLNRSEGDIKVSQESPLANGKSKKERKVGIGSANKKQQKTVSDIKSDGSAKKRRIRD